MPVRSIIITAAVVGVMTGLFVGCESSEKAAPASEATSSEVTSVPTTVAATPTCSEAVDGESDLPATYRTKGKELVGDVDGDDREDRVTLRTDKARPGACRYVLVAEIRDEIAVAPLAPLDWPGTNPQLVLLAEVDGRSGLEPVVALSPVNVYEPGAVFTMREGKLERMRLAGRDHGDLFPLDDEFPAGVDCAGEPGAIVVTFGGLADGGRDDSHWDIKRSFFRAAGLRFEPVREEGFRVEVGPETPPQWPELAGHPFVSCPDRVVRRP